MKTRSTCLSTMLLAGLFVLCMAGILLALAAWWLPQQASQVFGPPSPALSSIQRSIYAARLVAQQSSLTQPRQPGASLRPFEVQLGEPASSVIDRLYAEGFIENPDALRTYLQYRGLDTTLQAGEYTIGPGMSPVQIAQAMQDATPTHVRFGILPGWRLEEIAAALPTSGLAFTPQEFLAAAQVSSPSYIVPFEIPAQASVEGLLYPDMYRLPRDINPQEFIQIAMDNIALKLSPELLAGFDNQGLSPYQAVTLASIVEREAIVDEEMALIASVFINRLAAGMKLDSDPTTQYALGFNTAQNTWWTNPLSAQDLQIDSPYNTYLYPGLPPGPIANPGLAALQAVAAPAQSPYYYFRALCDDSGKHVFAETFEQHLQNACP